MALGTKQILPREKVSLITEYIKYKVQMVNNIKGRKLQRESTDSNCDEFCERSVYEMLKLKYFVIFTIDEMSGLEIEVYLV